MRIEVRKVADAIAKLGLPLTGVVLFGSYARGDQRLTSDVDIAVVTTIPVTRQQRQLVVRAVSEFETAENLLEVHCYFTTEDAVQTAHRWSDPCLAIREEGVVLWGQGDSEAPVSEEEAHEAVKTAERILEVFGGGGCDAG